MKDALAFRPVLLIAGAAGLCMSLVAFCVSHGLSEFLVPGPDASAEQFCRALNADRFEAAAQQMAAPLQRAGAQVALRNFKKRLEEEGWRFEYSERAGASIDGARAQASVRLRDVRRREQMWRFLLIRESHEWKIAEWSRS